MYWELNIDADISGVKKDKIGTNQKFFSDILLPANFSACLLQITTSYCKLGAFHLLSRIIYMSTSIVSGIAVFIFVSNQPGHDVSQHKKDLILGIYMCGKFVWGFYFWLCVHSFYRQLEYYDLP